MITLITGAPGVVAPSLTPDSYTANAPDYQMTVVVAPSLTPDSYTGDASLSD